MWTNIKPHVNLDEMFVRWDELIFKSLFLKDSTMFSATVTLFLLFSNVFSDPPLMGGFFTLYSFLSDYLDRILVIHRNLHLSACPIRHFLWLSVHGGNWDGIVQGSSPHKCGQKSCCSAFNAVIAAFLLDISTFLSSSYVLEVRPYRWTFLESHPSRLCACLIDVNPIREG